MQRAEKQIFVRKLRPLTAMVAKRKASSQLLLDTLVVEWTKTNYSQVDLSGFQHSARYASRPPVQGFLDWLCALDFLEAAYWLSSVYALWSGDAHRQQFAVFFTPPSLTKRLLDDLADSGVKFDESSFIDPACGGAAFLAPITQRIRDALKAKGHTDRQILDHVVEHVHGTDIDEQLCALSRHFMRIVLREEIAATDYGPDLRISQADSLRSLGCMYERYDVVVSNPPYRKMTAGEVASVGADFSEVIQSQPNLYGLFIALCVKLLRPNGHAALVTPTSFLTGQYFSRLRRYLAMHTTVLRIGMVSDRKGVFIDVEQETALTIVRRGGGEERLTLVSVVGRDGSYQNVGSCLLSDQGVAWPIPRNETDVQLLSRAGEFPARLSDYGYTVRIGAFVWNRDERPSFFDHEVRKKKKYVTAVPLVWSSDIGTDGYLKHGNKTKAHIEPSWVDVGSKEHSAVVRNPAVILQRVTSNDQPKRLVGAVVPREFIAKHGGFVAENHVVVLEQTSKVPAVDLRTLVDLLASATVDRFFRCISGSTNVSVYELGGLPLPGPSAVQAVIEYKFSS